VVYWSCLQIRRKHRLPTVVGTREYVEAGGLVGYAAGFPDLYRHAAVYGDDGPPDGRR
jgi:hypothetical protein